MAGYISRLALVGVASAYVLGATACHTPSGRPVFYGNPDIPIIRYNPNAPRESVEDRVNQYKKEPAKDYDSGRAQNQEPKINFFDPAVQRNLRREAAKKQTIKSANDPRFRELADLIREKRYEKAREKHDAIKDNLTPSLENYYRGLGGR